MGLELSDEFEGERERGRERKRIFEKLINLCSTGNAYDHCLFIVLQNTGICPQYYTLLQPTRPQSPLWTLKNLYFTSDIENSALLTMYISSINKMKKSFVIWSYLNACII